MLPRQQSKPPAFLFRVATSPVLFVHHGLPKHRTIRHRLRDSAAVLRSCHIQFLSTYTMPNTALHLTGTAPGSQDAAGLSLVCAVSKFLSGAGR